MSDDDPTPSGGRRLQQRPQTSPTSDEIARAVRAVLDDRSANREQDETTKMILDLPERVGRIEETHKRTSSAANKMLGAAFGSLLLVASLLWTRAGDEREYKIRLQQLESLVNRLVAQLLSDDHRRSSSPLAPFLAPKDSP